MSMNPEEDILETTINLLNMKEAGQRQSVQVRNGKGMTPMPRTGKKMITMSGKENVKMPKENRMKKSRSATVRSQRVANVASEVLNTLHDVIEEVQEEMTSDIRQKLEIIRSSLTKHILAKHNGLSS
jgi:hypothetical protein